VLAHERHRARPRRDAVDRLGQRHADHRSERVARATRPAGFLKVGYKSPDLRGVEQAAENLGGTDASRWYFGTCHPRLHLDGLAPGSVNCAGAAFCLLFLQDYLDRRTDREAEIRIRKGKMAVSAPTAIGYYTAREVARLAGVSPRRIGSWARYGIILPSVSRRPNIYSYADAGEAIVAHYLMREGKKPRELRAIIHRLREEFSSWPLTTADLHHEGRLMVIKRDGNLFDVTFPNEQEVIGGTFLNLVKIRQALRHGGWVSIDEPREHIEVDPDRHSGEPVVRGRRLTTARVAALALLSNGRETLREDFELTDAEIDDAVGYEGDVAALAA
jgi:uncharacterized protein (DUF433 family)/DNA-binding transcriptional MerR regulator